MLLNKIPCLDKGWVAHVDSTCSSSKLKPLALEFFKSTDSGFLRSSLSNMTIIVRCPLFVQLSLSTKGFTVVPVPPSEVEAYCPNVGEIKAPDHQVCRDIEQNMAAATAALLINPQAYQRDGCDRFTSQVLTPISTYTTLIVQGTYEQWRAFCYQDNLPDAVKAYANAVQQILCVEWK